MFTTIEDQELSAVHGGGAVRSAGEAVGFGAGVAVTAGLRLVRGWNEQVPGKPAGFQKRHEPVVGPKLARYADGLGAGAWKEFTSGVGAGATAAPQWSFDHGL